MRHICTSVALAMVLAGCAAKTPPLVSTGSLQVVEGELPPPTAAIGADSRRVYRIGPFDKLDVDVFGVEEFARREIQVDGGGRITFPLVGSVQAAGMTTQQLTETLRARLAGRYVRDPQVTVNVTDAASQNFTIEGQVTEPGIYPALGDMTLLRAVARAKGASEFAKLDDVVVLRTVGEQRMAALYNLASVRRGIYADPAIYPGDVVVVGDSPQRRMFRDVLQATPLLTAPLVLLAR